MDIRIEKTKNPKAKPDENNLGFGVHFTDHMFIMDYTQGKGWHDPRIVPYGPLSMDPACMILHYGQGIFEGMKAYKSVDGDILLFRPEKNMERVNISNERLCIPPVDVDFAVKCIMEIVKTDKDWVPTAPGTSLYIRPFIIATDNKLGVHPSHTYKFIIILSPVGAYYPEGIDPVKIYVESNYVRATPGGMGYAKTPGNYAASIKAQMDAEEKGYTQVLWLDGVEKKYIEEVGTMNVFFVIGDEVVTPELNGSILAGITRNSTIELLKNKGYNVVERRLGIKEVYDAWEKNELKEAFGTGTAAVISPIGELNWNGKKIIINKGEIGPISQLVYDTITGIQSGKIKDEYNWTKKIE
ncbi:MAG: branched-chain amino acid aminotransferase [Methanosarcinaceae archaeon]|nr:branched-chain amino acid aminotransferase [Methanosarcinaceae archaeon]